MSIDDNYEGEKFGESNVEEVSASEDWAIFSLQYTFDSELESEGQGLEYDGLVVYDPQHEGNDVEDRVLGDAYIAADEGSHVSAKEIR